MAAEPFYGVVQKDWKRFSNAAFLLRSPALHVPSIKAACDLDGGGWMAAAVVILAALPATNLSIPENLLTKLGTLATQSTPASDEAS